MSGKIDFCLALPWWVDRVGAGVSSCGVLQAVQANRLGDTCRLYVILWAQMPHLYMSRAHGGGSQFYLCWSGDRYVDSYGCVIVVDIHRYGGSLVHSLQVAIHRYQLWLSSERSVCRLAIHGVLKRACAFLLTSVRRISTCSALVDVLRGSSYTCASSSLTSSTVCPWSKDSN